jgi:PKD repeat protein
MKRIILLTGLAAIMFAGCEPVHEHQPVADFSVSNTLVIRGEVVFFDNLSQFAGSCEWDFGDGTISRDFDPNHYYTHEGTYEVRLAAYNGGYVDYSYISIEVYETSLEVEVREYYSEDLISNVEVTLYETYDDWVNFNYPLVTGVTDRNGIVVFKGLETSRYYIDAFSTYYDNEQLGFEDIGFIETLPLVYATNNIFTAYVDYYPAGKANPDNLKSTDRVRTPVIKEFKRVFKEKKTLADK